MWFDSVLDYLKSGPAHVVTSGSRRQKPYYRRRLLVEPLEDRWVPTTIVPTTFADGVLGSGSLRDAVLQFNADTGTADDTIQLLAGTYTLTIRNSHGHESAGLEGDLDLTRASHRWIIQGAGSSTIIDASQLQDRVFQIVNPGTPVVFRNLVIQSGLAQDNGTEGALPGTTDALGGGILNNGGNVTLDNVVLTNNVARGGNGAILSNGHNAQGGGIYSTGGSLSISGSTLTNNQAIGGNGTSYEGGGGGAGQGASLYATAGLLSISGSTLVNNQATGGNGGGGRYGGHGGAPGGFGQGAGVYATGVSLSISGGTFANNQATGGKGGDGTLIDDFAGPGAPGGAGQGAGLYATGGSLTISGSTFANNQATGGNGGAGGPGGVGGEGQGAGLNVSGATISLTNSTLSSNAVRGGNGGNGYVECNGGNGGAGQGGAIYDSTAPLAVTNVTVATNTVRGGDGGNGGDGSRASGNGGTGGAGQGGGLFSSSATVTINNSTLATNTVRGGDGGTGGDAQWWYVGGGNGGTGGAGQGAALFSSGSITFTNSTLSTNTVRGGNGGAGGIGNGFYFYGRGGNGGNGAAGLGGGMYVSGTFTLTNGTVAFNTAQASLGGAGGTGSPPGNPGSGGTGQGGGVANAGGTLHALNTLVGDNTAASASDLSGPLASLGHNLIGNSNGGSGYTATDLLDVDPLLGPLHNNGGPTLTHALLPGSPAIDAGDNTGATDFDQRGPGFARIVNGVIDIGAFEVQAATQATHYSVSAPATAVAGSAFNVTVTALNDSGNPVTGYTGTVHFTSSDAQAILPSDYTFTSGDAGVHTFSVTLKTVGAQSITATGTTDGLTGSATGILVSPAAASTLTFTGVPSTVTAGGAFGFTVTARDPFNNIATGYRGTVTFTSTDSQATLPANYTFTAADGGVHTFSGAILRTAGSRTLTAQDTADGTITGSGTVTVNPAAADHFRVSAPGTVTAGAALDVTVTALDAFNNTATGYTRTVSFTSTDASAVLPHDYTFAAADQGVHTFTNGVTLKTAGTQTITVTGTRIPTGTGIVSWWPGDGNTNDIVGGNNGTLHGGATFAPGIVGQAFSFPSAGAYFQAPANGLPTGNSDRTMELWVYINAFVTTEAMFASYGVFGIPNQAYGLGTSGSTVFFSQWGLGITGPSLQTGTWYHVAVTNVGNFATLYLNGTAVASGTLPINTPGGAYFYMGSVPAPYGATRQLNGLTDEAAVYNRALSAEEIRAIFDAGSAGHYRTITGSATVAVRPAAADHLLFLQQPTDTAAGQSISPAVTVEIVDQFGNVLTDDNNDTVTLSLGTNPSGGTLSGTPTVTVSGGIATFSDLSIDLVGDGYTLHATIGGSLLDIDSNAFRIT